MKQVSFKLVLLVSLLLTVFPDANRADPNHLGQCDTNLECYTMGCIRGPGYCDNGVCRCPKVQAVDTKRADLNHLGQCDTNLECYTMGCIRGPGYCDNGVCRCPK
ncbi:unnamed protein product [Thlaspi arvense]|uniref:Uncharacterized protein n=1 Tax=Thlaspi arvense TaxID=13288 RepID=A0AAU9RGK9_THLAR|nr:unnamed protein product [Thlaspi arvense]